MYTILYNNFMHSFIWSFRKFRIQGNWLLKYLSGRLILKKKKTWTQKSWAHEQHTYDQSLIFSRIMLSLITRTFENVPHYSVCHLDCSLFYASTNLYCFRGNLSGHLNCSLEYFQQLFQQSTSCHGQNDKQKTNLISNFHLK